MRKCICSGLGQLMYLVHGKRLQAAATEGYEECMKVDRVAWILSGVCWSPFVFDVHMCSFLSVVVVVNDVHIDNLTSCWFLDLLFLWGVFCTTAHRQVNPPRPSRFPQRPP